MFHGPRHHLSGVCLEYEQLRKHSRYVGVDHNLEVQFYDDVASNAPQVPSTGAFDDSLPKVYATGACETGADISSAFILMEDLGERGGLANVGKGLSKGQVRYLAFLTQVPGSDRVVHCRYR